MIKTASTFALVLLLSGCAQQTFKMHSAPVSSPQKVITHHFFISGLGQQKTIDAAAICGTPDKVVRTETQQTFVNGLLAFVTLGIYTPLEARVYCSN
ncbi:lipoprotein bor [Salmonella enterica]|uniref:Bor family protein n=1 Tax=Salmonella enterica TaxID=28901 RepID=UPI00127DA491|nr:Bor family protein [Salmonella enterica]EAM2866695.1 lipoprotein bor [Salmonella enterica]EAM8770758.1 lipoprotein bor [Salmonella enterica]EAP0380780.1 lipoprotein bor [Salmonella enterica]EBQ7680929.1 lipoprotein bor [Salmonella enterica]HCZ5349378.1 Bor family protein [Salmonella enterica]